MSRFASLLQREWLQHRRGWLVLMALPLLLAVAAPFLPLQVEFDGEDGGLPPAPLVFAVTCVAVTGLVFAEAWIATLFQAPGLARSDYQDRSIEFWLSLPVGHSASIGASLLMHAVLMPMAVLLVGFVSGVLVANVAVWRLNGHAEWLALPWPLLMSAGAAALSRLLFGVVLASLWLSPLVLLPMAASAWLKRWGVPAVVGTLGVAHAVLANVYGITWVGDTFRAVGIQAARALIGAIHANDSLHLHNSTDITGLLGELPAWVAHDALDAVVDLAQPLFLGVLVVSAACFVALVLRRRQGAA